jgi:hypothetical protein
MYEIILEKSLKECSDELERQLRKFCKYEKQMALVRKHTTCTGETKSNIFKFRRCLTDKSRRKRGKLAWLYISVT